nr:Dihydrofolate reductase [uncultured bacterium]
MRISMIAAIGKDRQIGLKGDIPWSEPADLKVFKKLTMGHHLIIGRKTFESLKAPLPGRKVVVLSSKIPPSPEYKHFSTLTDALQSAKAGGEDECFIAGGANVYAEGLGFAERIYLTRVAYDGPADAFFPPLPENWAISASEPLSPTARLEIWEKTH